MTIGYAAHISAERLTATAAAKARLEARQRDAAHGRTPDDKRKPKDKNGKPKGRKVYQRDYGVPAPKAQDSLTNPESHIMKRAGSSFDHACNAQTAVDETVHISSRSNKASLTTANASRLPSLTTDGSKCFRILPVQHAGATKGMSQVQARLPGA